MARELPIRNGRLTTDLDADGHKIKNLGGGTSSVSWDDVTGKPTFATVATSGSYNDLTDNPTIPAAVTVDSALSTTSENPVQNKVVTEALNARPTKAEMDEGWWSEWEIVHAVEPERTRIFWKDEEGIHGWVPQVGSGDAWSSVGAAKGDSNSTDLTWIGGVDAETDVTATRHRVAAPVPTKTSDLVNDGPDGVHPFLTSHQTWSEVKPSGGIPKTDLASAVQTSLGLADTAVQPAGIAAKLPMYALGATPTIDGRWRFTGDIELDPTKYSIVWSGEDGWDLYYDGNHVSEVSGSESDTEVEFSDAGVSGGDIYANLVNVLTVSPFTSATYAATSTASAFKIAVGALPTGVTGKVRDCILVIDCTATGAVAPTVTWPSNFHPRTDTATDLAIVEAGKRAVFYISEYMAGEFAVGGWQETAGGSGS